MTNCVYYWRLITRVYAQASFNTTKTLHWYYQKKKTNEQNCTLLRSQQHHLKSFLEVLLEKLRKITKPTLEKSWLVAYSLLIPQELISQERDAFPLHHFPPSPHLPQMKEKRRTSAALRVYHSHSQPTVMNFPRGMTSQETDLTI